MFFKYREGFQKEKEKEKTTSWSYREREFIRAVYRDLPHPPNHDT
jgi:hypothetical protein